MEVAPNGRGTSACEQGIYVRRCHTGTSYSRNFDPGRYIIKAIRRNSVATAEFVVCPCIKVEASYGSAEWNAGTGKWTVIYNFEATHIGGGTVVRLERPNGDSAVTLSDVTSDFTWTATITHQYAPLWQASVIAIPRFRNNPPAYGFGVELTYGPAPRPREGARPFGRDPEGAFFLCLSSTAA